MQAYHGKRASVCAADLDQLCLFLCCYLSLILFACYYTRMLNTVGGVGGGGGWGGSRRKHAVTSLPFPGNRSQKGGCNSEAV